jgi:hypothetical protein
MSMSHSLESSENALIDTTSGSSRITKPITTRDGKLRVATIYSLTDSLIPVAPGTLVEDLLSFFSRGLRDKLGEDPSKDKPGDKSSNVGKERDTTRYAGFHS